MIDDWILLWIQGNLRCAFLDFLMPVITALGNLGFLWILITLTLLMIKRYRRDGVTLLTALVLFLLIGNFAIKLLVARPRPCHTDPLFELLIPLPLDYSFPSGHTMSSFAAATVLYRVRRSWGIGAFIIGTLIGFSRLYLYVHYPSDVLAGMVLGILVGMLVLWARKNLENRLKTVS